MGETATKESVDMENYKYRNNPIMHSVSLTNNDAAYVLLGKHWKMPTKKEMQESSQIRAGATDGFIPDE